MNDDDDHDRWEFAPEGEGHLTPDAHDATPLDDGSYERADAPLTDPTAGYPDPDPDHDGCDGDSEGPPAHTCRSCGAAIPAERTKCNFCLVNKIDAGDAGDAATPSTSKRTLTGIIHTVVTAATETTAITKAEAAFSDLSADPVTTDGPTIDDYELVAHADGATARQLAREWGQLPDAAHIDTLDGQRLLDTIRQNAGWDYAVDEDTDATKSGTDGDDDGADTHEFAPVVFDADGEPITDRDALAELLGSGSLARTTASWAHQPSSGGDEHSTWIVPAFGLQHVTPEADQPSAMHHEGSKRRSLACVDCDEATVHSFSGYQEIPDSAWSGDPLWTCTRCGMPQFGPDPATIDPRPGETDDS